MAHSDLIKHPDDRLDALTHFPDLEDMSLVVRFSTERGRGESGADPDWLILVQLAGVGRNELEPGNHTLLIRRPVVDLANHIYSCPDAVGWRPGDLDAPARNGKESGYLPVLVGVGETVKVPEGMVTRIWLTMVGLELLDLGQSVDDSPQGAASVRGLDGAHSIPVSLRMEEDRKLMLLPKLGVAGIDKGRHDVIECTPEVMHDIPQEHAESWLRDLIGDKDHIAPASLLVDLTKPEFIRATLLDADRYLSLQHFKVLKGTIDLSVTRTEVKA
jgi:hypothetical protein